MFAPIEIKIVNLATGEYVPSTIISPNTYNQLKAALSKVNGRDITAKDDIAKLHRLEKYSLVYLVKKNGRIQQIILPVRGKGLWSTMYAYVALDGDLRTIRGISFYEHGETPGLGGEIENKKWQNGWRGKKMYNDAGKMVLQVVKGKSATSEPEQSYQIDGLSGATLTTKGVDSLMDFWFGDHGFKPFFARLQKNREKKSNG